jgi:RNA polymerase sigma factor (sigma-70 family)
MQGNKLIIRSTDEELMLDVQNGNMAAFEALYDRYHQRLFHFILRFVRERALAEDILQETFIRLLKGRKKFRKGSRFSTYLFTIGRNLCLDALKTWERKHILVSQNDNLLMIADPSENPGKMLQEAEKAKLLEIEIRILPQDQREVLLLSKYSGLSFKEIALITDSTPAAVKQKVYRAMLSLKQKSKNYND